MQMSEGKRPGGLTALAVINFIFAGFGFLGAIGFITMIAMFSMAGRSAAANKASQDVLAALQNAGIGQSMLIILMIISFITSVLLLISGIGYLKQKKMLGWWLGNFTAILSIVSHLITAVKVPSQAGGGFSLGFILNMLYPLITLILLNTTFKDDFESASPGEGDSQVNAV
jgi:hypothetical protein